MTMHFRIQAVVACSLDLNVHSNVVGVMTTPINYVTFFTDYASNNSRKNMPIMPEAVSAY